MTDEKAPKATEVEAVFTEETDDGVTASFPALNGSKPFVIKLQNMTWGLLEDMERIQDLEAQKDEGAKSEAASLLLGFWREYVVGGPRAVPIKHTGTVFKAIFGYMKHVTGDQVAEKN